ncbi:MAG: type II secretion system protein GspG [Candidatus Omnitrophota bacterium]
MQNNKIFKSGFTIMEILVIIAVLGILMGLVSRGGTLVRKKAKIYQAKTMIAALETALALYHVDFGAYPGSGNQNLVNLLADSATYSSVSDWNGPYLSFKPEDLNATIPNATVIDSWGNDLYYNLDSLPPYRIWSSGPNLIDENGLGDDIKSW